MKTRKYFLIIAMMVAGLVVSGTASAKKAAKYPSIVEVAMAVNSAPGPLQGQFSVLIGLVAGNEAAFETLTGKGQYTVFAPTNDAFTDLFAAADANCITLTPELVGDVLLYHVAKGRRDASDITTSDRVRTLGRQFFHVDGAFITDNNGGMSEIIATDVPASNGLIHVITAVLLPFEVESEC